MRDGRGPSGSGPWLGVVVWDMRVGRVLPLGEQGQTYLTAGRRYLFFARYFRLLSFSLTLSSMVPFMTRRRKGRSISTRTSLSVTETCPFVPLAAPFGASKVILSPSHFQTRLN